MDQNRNVNRTPRMPMYCRVYRRVERVVRIEIYKPGDPPSKRSERASVRAEVFEVAAYVESIAAKESLALHVEAHPEDHMLDVVLEVTDEALGTVDLAADAFMDLGVEACHCCGLSPDPNY